MGYCQSKLPDHENINCDNYLPGGITECVIFDEDATTTDYTDGGQIQADITAGRATLLTDMILDLPQPSEKSVANPVDNRAITAGYDRTLNIVDWNVTAGNVEFYNAANAFLAKAVLIYEPLNDGVGHTQLIFETKSGISFSVNKEVPQGDGTFQQFAGVATWSKFDMPVIKDIPAGIFNQ